MSWDILLMKVPESIKSVSDMPDDYKSTLGLRSDIKYLLEKIFPGVVFDSTGVGHYDTEEFAVEFYSGEDRIVDNIMLAIRGNDSVIPLIRRICSETGWRALDSTQGEFIDFENHPAAGLNQWRAYRDFVISTKDSNEKRGK